MSDKRIVRTVKLYRTRAKEEERLPLKGTKQGEEDEGRLRWHRRSSHGRPTPENHHSFTNLAHARNLEVPEGSFTLRMQTLANSQSKSCQDTAFARVERMSRLEVVPGFAKVR